MAQTQHTQGHHKLTNASNLHARTCKSSKRSLSTRTWSFCLVSTSSTELNVQSSNSKLLNRGGGSPYVSVDSSNLATTILDHATNQLFWYLTSYSNILRCKHSCIRGWFITISFDLHATWKCNSLVHHKFVRRKKETDRCWASQKNRQSITV